jgi:hypothetical protein
MSLDLSTPIRNAIIAETSITSMLDAYKASFPVFTRVPAPDDAPYPMIIAHAQFGGGDEDGVNDLRPIVVRDVSVYGQNDSAEHYRATEALAFNVWELFHRQHNVITVTGWSVTDVRAQLPRPAPTDDEKTVARRVQLTIRLARKN